MRVRSLLAAALTAVAGAIVFNQPAFAQDCFNCEYEECQKTGPPGWGYCEEVPDGCLLVDPDECLGRFAALAPDGTILGSWSGLDIPSVPESTDPVRLASNWITDCQGYVTLRAYTPEQSEAIRRSTDQLVL